jgi:hypothetical protein
VAGSFMARAPVEKLGSAVEGLTAGGNSMKF